DASSPKWYKSTRELRIGTASSASHILSLLSILSPSLPILLGSWSSLPPPPPPPHNQHEAHHHHHPLTPRSISPRHLASHPTIPFSRRTRQNRHENVDESLLAFLDQGLSYGSSQSSQAEARIGW
ncbi:hypothetical protein BJ508DRAFT_338064, partial [Ascobolus immersus RN42]